MDIRTGFSGRSIFMTGGTGFVGKVVLYKILKEFPDIRCVYLLMRGKKSRRYKRYLKPQERLELDVLGSPCFEPLRTSVGDAKWKQLCDKVVAMSGDITEDHVGLSERDRTTVAKEVNLILHLAATVNFNERLDLAVQMNTLGGLRVLALAKTCERLESMVHVSTCYVNYRRQGKENLNEEKMYPLGFDAEGMCKTILNLHPREVEAEGRRLVKELGFPNTYTFTKSMGEQLILKYKENVPIAIVRPSIVAASYYEPVPGWVDALTAAGGLILTASLGVVHEFTCRPEMTADVVPVDFVVVVILKALFRTQQLQKALYGDAAASRPSSSSSSSPTSDAEAAQGPVHTAAVSAMAGTAAVVSAKSGGGGGGALAVHPTTAATAAGRSSGSFMNADLMLPAAVLSPEEAAAANCAQSVPIVIYQASTTGTTNRTSWARLTVALQDYMRTAKRHPKALSDFKVYLTDKRYLYLLRYGLFRYVPYLALKTAAMVPGPLGLSKGRGQIERLGKATRRSFQLNDEFHDFVMTEWFFSCANTLNLDDGLDERSRRAFRFDPYCISWYVYTQLYAYGIFKYIVRETGDFKCPMVPPSATELFTKASKL